MASDYPASNYSFYTTYNSSSDTVWYTVATAGQMWLQNEDGSWGVYELSLNGDGMVYINTNDMKEYTQNEQGLMTLVKKPSPEEIIEKFVKDIPVEELSIYMKELQKRLSVETKEGLDILL